MGEIGIEKKDIPEKYSAKEKSICKKRKGAEHKMDERIKLWLESELKEYEAALREYNRKLMNMAYIGMAVCAAFPVILGFGMGRDVASILKMQLPGGCVLAFIVWICCWEQKKTATVKKVRTAYEKEIAAFFQSEEEKEVFIRQMENHNYGAINFTESSFLLVSKYPYRFIAGPDYFVFSTGSGCSFIRTANIRNADVRKESSQVRTNVGGSNVKMNISAGVSLYIELKEAPASASGFKEECICLRNESQVTRVRELIKEHCPASKEFMILP